MPMHTDVEAAGRQTGGHLMPTWPISFLEPPKFQKVNVRGVGDCQASALGMPGTGWKISGNFAVDPGEGTAWGMERAQQGCDVSQSTLPKQ